MTLERHAQWLARGRAHQAADRLIDALLCYRRALREAPRGADAQFHIGEIAWRMGNRAEAIAAWRAAGELAPSHVASWHALADALASAGDLEASADAATRVLELRPDEPRAAALGVLLAAAAGDASDASLAHALRTGTGWPLALLARIVERVLATRRQGALPQAMPALLDVASAAAVTRGEEDALRRIALALASAAEAERACAFAEAYARACRALYRPSIPLLWPLRTAGELVRAGLLVAPDRPADADAFRAGLARAGLDVRLACTVLVASEAAPGPADAFARTIAALDLDVLIDLCGLRHATGPLLALHPARTIWSVGHEAVPAAPALADRVFAGDERASAHATAASDREPGSAVPPAALLAALRELPAKVALAPAAPWTARESSMRWEAAVQSHQAGDLAAAREGYASVLEVQPDCAPAHYLAGSLARAEGDDAGAREYFRAAIRAAPDYVDARVALVNALVATGETADALAIARGGLAAAPESAPLWRAIGHAELKLGDTPGAITAFEEALQRDPTDGETHYNHGVALQTARRAADAARAYQRALALRPDLHAADFNLGVIFDQQGNAAAAISAFSNVLARAPGHVGAYKALAETLLATGRIDAWYANFERFERNCPGHLTLATLALEACAYRADFAKLAGYLDGLRQERFKADRPEEMLDALQQLLYLLHFFDVEPALIGKFARTHDALARSLYGEPWPRAAARRPGKLRVGYLSGDFRNHVMGKMVWEALRRHDRTRFEITGYATSDAHDEWTARFASASSAFHVLATMPDAAAARRIAADDLDVLVDLSTHTKGARPGILALKPARVQITHVASAGTLAMSAVDFKLTDRYADTEHDPQLQIEPLLPMEGCVYPYRHVAPSESAAPRRDALGIPGDAVVIGAFCTPLKLSQRCLALWREALERIPNAVLAFSPLHPGLRSAFQRIAAVAGIDASRIVFVPQGRDDAGNQARYRLIDFVLDPMPYGGVNGTLEALDMGVPVVTLVGRRHAERTSYSILANLGVTDTIAQTGSEYVAIAERLATDGAFMRAVRERIAAGLRGSALTDMDAHTRHLEDAYVRALAARAPEVLAGIAP